MKNHLSEDAKFYNPSLRPPITTTPQQGDDTMDEKRVRELVEETKDLEVGELLRIAIEELSKA